MKSVLSGTIKDFDPVCFASIKEGRIVFGKNKNLAITVDTGFTDYFALPKHILKRMDLQYKGIETYILANGEHVEEKVYRGEAIVNGKILKTLFIQGDHLIGMRFLSQIGNQLCVDLKKNKVKLIK